jgi:hypothetical protein
MKILSVVAAMFFLVAGGATAETTNDLSDAEIQGRNLAQKILEQQPTENSTNTGVLKIRDNDGNYTNFVVSCKVIVLSNGWQSIYEIGPTNLISHNSRLSQLKLFINHIENQTNSYKFEVGVFEINNGARNTIISTSGTLAGQDLLTPFAFSDFWICDLGLEFFHWPEQKVLKHELRRSRACTVLESTNPNPSANGYSRVVSWIDDETLGIVHAEAYDANGKLLKEFDPKSFKKVNGQWELQEMEIRNVQTGSRTRLEFDLKTHGAQS